MLSKGGTAQLLLTKELHSCVLKAREALPIHIWVLFKKCEIIDLEGKRKSPVGLIPTAHTVDACDTYPISFQRAITVTTGVLSWGRITFSREQDIAQEKYL